jgi:hypothetical protein
MWCVPPLSSSKNKKTKVYLASQLILKKCCFNIVYAYKYILNMYAKVGLVEETKGGRKEGKKDRK